jgi:DNA polymerase-3 subunit delta
MSAGSAGATTAGPGTPAPVTVITGSEELLISRAVARVVAAVAAAAGADPAGPDAALPVQVHALEAAETDAADLADLISPSLFADPRVVALRHGEDLAADLRPALLAFAADPLPDVYLVVALAGGPRGRPLRDGLTKGGAQLLTCTAPTRARERWDFVQQEAHAAGGEITAGACRAVVEAVGSDLRQLAVVTAQLVADSVGLIDEEVVARYHRGRAETRGFDVAEATLSGDLPAAMALLGAALDGGLAPVVLTATLASGLRDLATVRAASGPPAAVAAALKMPPWKVEKTLRTARGWTDDALAAAVGAVAAADAAVKGAAVDPVYVLERVVVTLTRQRTPARAASR